MSCRTLDETRDMADPRGIPRPFPSEHPRPLTMEIRTVAPPRSNVVNIRSRNVLVYRPGWPVFDWATEPEFCTPG